MGGFGWIENEKLIDEALFEWLRRGGQYGQEPTRKEIEDRDPNWLHALHNARIVYESVKNVYERDKGKKINGNRND